MKFVFRTLFILLLISFVFGQNWNSKGTIPVTFRVRVEPYLPPDEIMIIDIKKNGAAEEGGNSIHYQHPGNRTFHVPMEKISPKEWEVTVELDTAAYEYIWGASMFQYEYLINHEGEEEFAPWEGEANAFGGNGNRRLPSDSSQWNAGIPRWGFNWHVGKTSVIQIDTLKNFEFPTINPETQQILNTTGHLTTAPSNIQSSDFITGASFYDWHRYYWSSVIENWMDNVVRTNSTWMMIVPVRHGIKQNPPEFDFENKHSNALPDSNFVKMIKEAHKRGLKVYVNNLEVLGGYMNWDESVINREWYIKWLAERRKDMLHLATIAQEHGVEMFKFNLWHVPRIIDEYESLVDSISLVVLNEVKAIYKGKIIMDWRDKDPTLKIYEHADMFRMTIMANDLTSSGYQDTDEPSVENILAAVRKMNSGTGPGEGQLLALYQKYGKPILLEFLFASSYTGAPGSDGAHWDNVPGITTWYGNDPTIPIDQQVQANTYEALMTAAHDYDWIEGVFSFNYALSDRHDKEASIRGKLAEQVIQKWYRWINPNKTHLTTTINENTTIAPYAQGGTVSHQGSYVLSKDTTVTVTASADDGYGFVKWTGDASGTSPSVTVSMDTDKVISAIFEIVNQSPVVAALSDTTMKEDESITVRLSATDEEGDAITFSAVSDATLIVSLSSDTLTITPKLNWHGVASVIVYASDGTSKGQTTFDITVTPVNDIPTVFEWVSSALDTVNITQSNLAETYTLQWGASTDAADGDSINYLVYAKVGVHPAEEIYDTTVTSVSITYQEILEGVFEGSPVNSATVSLNLKATDGIDTVNVTGDDRVLFVNRYEYLSTESEGIPTEFALHENYPNPFNPTTTLRFDLPEVSDVTLSIYNMLGQKVRTFNYQNTSAGYHSVKWNATNDYGDPVGAGVYLYQLQTKDFVKTRKMVLLK